VSASLESTAQAESVTVGMYGCGTALLAVAYQLQAIRLGGDGILNPSEARRLTNMAELLNGFAGELHSKATLIAKDNGVEYPPTEGGE
jgi:hypothetical protein